MKALRFILWLLAILVVIFLVLGLVEPKDMTIQRSTTINAPKSAVFEQIRYFKNSNKWNPWMEYDPNVKTVYKGTDGEQGSSYTWDGNEQIGAGEMTNTGITDATLNYSVHFIKPHDGNGTGFMKAEDTAGMTKVTWSMSMHCSFPMNAMTFFMGGKMDKMIGGEFEKGLAKLKTMVESSPAQGSVAIQEVQFPAHIYAGVRKTISMSDMHNFFMDSYTMLGKTIKPTGAATGLYYTWDEKAHTTDVMAAMPVADSSKKANGMWYTAIPASKAYMAVHKGGYASSMTEHMALGKYVADKGQKSAVVIEEYVVGPNDQKDSTQWVTNIYYVLQ